MLQTKKLSNMYWTDVVRTSFYILNRIPTSSLDGITPYEGWYGKNPNVKHFEFFYYLAYAHITDEQRRKINPKIQKCVFIRYSEYSKAYRLYNPKTYKFVVSRDVMFYEGGIWGHQKHFVDDGYQDESSSQVHPIAKNSNKIPPPSPKKSSTSSTSSSNPSSP